MEDVLDVYAEPYDPTRPKVNFDETNKQLIQETRQPLPARPGQPQRYDYEYARNGTRDPGPFSFRIGGCTTDPERVKGFCPTWGLACPARPA